jgi:hypothetical protein
MTTEHSPDALRAHAARAIKYAISAVDIHNTPVAVEWTTYALNLTRYAATLAPSPQTTAPVEVSPPDDHTPTRGDVYEYLGAHYVIASAMADDMVIMLQVGGSLDRTSSYPIAADYVRRYCRRVSPPRGDLCGDVTND